MWKGGKRGDILYSIERRINFLDLRENLSPSGEGKRGGGVSFLTISKGGPNLVDGSSYSPITEK